ncbi:MAG: UDP-glucose 4-epimerase [Pseudomonadota bacterium]|jgi:UDP-glucose 4-epimerase
MTVLVLGAGLIGGLTAQLLAQRGDKVVLADVRDGAAPDGVLRVRCDVTDEPALKAIMQNHGVRDVVHTAAWLSTAIRQDPLKGIGVNIMGTAHVLECARTLGLRRVVLASSTTVTYTGFAAHGPQPIEEDLPLHVISERPASIYAACKLAGEHLAQLYHDLYGVDAVSLRYAAVLGDLGNITSVPGRLLQSLVQAGQSGQAVQLDDPFLVWGGREEFVDARDCARANVCALDAPHPQQRVYHIADGQWHGLGDFVAAVQRLYPALQVTWPDKLTTGFAGFPQQRPAPSDHRRAQSELGFVCAHGLPDSIAHWAALAPASTHIRP